MSKEKETYYIGLNHKNANIEIREKLAFANKEQIDAALKKFIDQDFIDECVILSTCNRIEIYIYAEKSIHSLEKSISLFFEIKNQNPQKYHSYLITKEGHEVYEYLFRVVSGLESMVFGENQILTQVKEAYYLAKKSNTTHYVMNKLFHSAITLGKKIRAETDINRGAISIAYAAVELCVSILKTMNNKVILLIGSGKTAEAVASNLYKKNCGKIFVANRTKENAIKIANKIGGKGYSLSKLEKLLLEADVVISSTSSSTHIIDKQLIQKVIKSKFTDSKSSITRQNKYLLMIDLAVPRDFSPDIAELDSVFLHTIDDLQLIAQNNLMQRHLDIPKVNVIIKEALHNFYESKKYQVAQVFICSLKAKLQKIAIHQLNKYENNLNHDKYQLMENILESTINKIIKDPILFIQEETDVALDSKNKIFLLEQAFNLRSNNFSYSQDANHKKKSRYK